MLITLITGIPGYLKKKFNLYIHIYSSQPRTQSIGYFIFKRNFFIVCVDHRIVFYVKYVYDTCRVNEFLIKKTQLSSRDII